MKITQIQRKTLSVIIKLLVFIATLYYLYIKVFKDGSLKDSVSDFEFNNRSFWLLIPVFILMLVNWSIEAGKWKMLISTFEEISFKRSFAAVWSGLTINNWVPNRMAEFAGRIIFINAGKRGKAIVSTFAGNMAQMMMTLIFGSLGLYLFYHFQGPYRWFIADILVLVNILFILFYFRMKWFVFLIKRIRFLHFLIKYIEILEHFSVAFLFRVVLLAMLRYLTYLSQYVMLLLLFGIDVDPGILYSGVALIFLIQTFIPSVMLTDIGVRGAVVLYVFEKVSPNLAGLLAAAYSIWFINLLIPSLFGALFILLKKKNKQLS
ncbi:MAG: flippase-like domain-containing protein [Bacteroidetes bacterium]|nr:flippase-like domain-containing protein [Bacteroidota bacterium]MBL6962235.1 flippase-like domain-containing protein [Bacteroidota bacterium]